MHRQNNLKIPQRIQARPKPKLPQFLTQLGNRTALILGTGFGVGFFPVAPGTVGSLWGLVLVWSWSFLELPPIATVAMIVTVVAIGIPICTGAARALGRHDPGQVVFDEIAAFPIVFIPALLFSVPLTATTLGLGFAWFRLFDVSKPWPVKQLEQFPDGLGVMADDLVAGVYAAAALWLTSLIFELN